MPGSVRIKLYAESLRLGRWPRSLAILPGVIATLIFHRERIPEILQWSGGGRILLAFVLTWIVSTANYIVNEITDAPYDAFHPGKKNRPLVRGEINPWILIVCWFFLVVVAAVLSLTFFKTSFSLSLGALLIAGILYNVPPLRVKDIPYLDSTLESANNPIRFLIGWYVLESAFPPLWLLLSWWAFGNFLMVGKRVAEKKFLSEAESAGYRMSLNKYSLEGLIAFMGANAALVIVAFAAFAWSSGITLLLYSLPFILIYLLIFIRKTIQDRDAAEEPEKLLRNPLFALYTIFLAIILLTAVFWR